MILPKATCELKKKEMVRESELKIDWLLNEKYDDEVNLKMGMCEKWKWMKFCINEIDESIYGMGLDNDEGVNRVRIE